LGKASRRNRLGGAFLCTVVSAQPAKPAAAATEERVAQFYLGDSHASIPRPEKELKGFAKVISSRTSQSN